MTTSRMASTLQKRLRSAVASALVALVLAAVAASAVIGTPGLAQERLREPMPHREPPAALDAADVYQRQLDLLDRALAGVKASRTERPQLFFVGFAGWGAQAVFKHEALEVRALFDARFGTKEHSLVLINHATTLGNVPLASSANLEKALRHIGGLMHKESDVLFLFLTSHGSNGVFAVEMPGLASDDLTPARLKAMLDGSGIKNRVVVLSACHSGSFIPALADASTLVITAAHADRTSFGCDDTREWTYFGDAFFNRALRQERSFERAFERAKRTIALWETKGKMVESLPQIAGGEELRPKLDVLARGKAGRQKVGQQKIGEE